jgi:hypothetical protein
MILFVHKNRGPLRILSIRIEKRTQKKREKGTGILMVKKRKSVHVMQFIYL